MNQRFLTNFSLVVIKYCEGESLFSMGNASFLRSEIFLSSNQNESSFENYLFYAETDPFANYDFKITIEFQQEVLFRHRLSNKYLSFAVEYQDEHNDSIVKLTLSDKPCYFRIAPCFQYQTKISPKVKFNEDIYLATELNSTKLALVTVEQGDHGQHLRTLLSLNERSKLILHAYCELEKEETGYVYGQAVWLKHVECNAFATVVRPDAEQNVAFERVDMEDTFQSINGLWLIESIKTEIGGNINYSQPFYFKSLCTQKYLSFEQEPQIIAGEKVYSPVLRERPSQHSKFMFESLKGEESKIRKGSYLILRHCLTGAYLGARNTRNDSFAHFPLLTFTEFEDQDLFDLIELKTSEEEAMRFIFSVKSELQYINRVLADNAMINKNFVGEIGNLYHNILEEMTKLTSGVMFQQVQEELGSSITAFCHHLQQLRGRMLKGQLAKQLAQLIKNIYQILTMICRNYKANQNIAYNFLQCFVEDVFTDSGAEELLSELFRNNYSLLCKISSNLKELRGCNIIKSIFSKVAKHNDKTGAYWIRILKLFDLLEVVLHHRGTTIDINQRLIATELFEQDTFTRIFFEVRVFNQRIRMLHPEQRRWVEIQQMAEARFLRILERIFNLLAKLCENRNFISKRYVDRYLNATNEEGVQTVISYLNILITPALSNYLFSLVTNCYIDSSPRINRYKPLAVLNFTISDKPASSHLSDHPDSLREGLLNKADHSEPGDKYTSLVWKVSNMLEGMESQEPRLNELEFDLYKEELEQRLGDGDWSQQLLRSLRILIRLESFSNAEVEDLHRMISKNLLDSKVNNNIIVPIMEIFQELTTHGLELELKKIVAFLKYRYANHLERDFTSADINHYLSYTPIKRTLRIKPEALEPHEVVAESHVVKKYRKEHNQLLTTLQGLSPSEKLKDKMLEIFISSAEDTPFSVLSAVFKTLLSFYTPRLRVVRLLARCIVLTHDEVENFEETFRLYKKVKHLISIAENWLSDPGPESKESKEYCYLILQFTNFLYEDYALNSHNDRRFRKTSKLNINRQLLVFNLNVHQDVLDLLNSNFYLLQLKEKHQVPPKIREVFETSFDFLYDFSHNCQQTLEGVAKRLETVERFRELAQVGQTKLLIQIYRDIPNLSKQVKSPIVEKMVCKILRGPLTAPAERPCEYNPEYLDFLNIICFSQGKINKKNLEIIFRVIEKDIVLKRLLFAGKDGLILDPSAFRSTVLQVPILYHKNLFRLLGLLLKHLEYSGNTLKQRIKESINIESLLNILALPDIYLHRGVIPELYFLLKKEAMNLVHLFLDKTDSLLRLYESQALGSLLKHYISIFLEGKQRKAFPCDNEVQFLPFLQQYAGEVKYDLGNQRDFFTSQVQPFLQRLLSLFEKYGKRDSSNNYSRLLALVEGVRVKDLPQDHLLRTEAHGIDLVQLKWRNFIDADQQNSPQEKFVKETLLELLRHDHSYELIRREREDFFSRVKTRQQEYFAMMSRLIAVASAEEGQTEQSQPSREFFYELIRNLAQYLVWSSQQQAQRRGWQGRELAETLLGYVTREQFQYNDAISRKTFYQILRILVFLIEHDQEGTLLRQFHKILSHGSSFRFFNHLREAVGEVSQRIVGDLAHEQINQALSQLYVCGEERRCQIDREALKLLALLCRYIPFTDLLRSQPFNTSTDFLDKIYNSFYFLVKRTHSPTLTINVAVVAIAQQLLNCVQAMLNGCNQSNQNYVIDNKFPEIVVEALKMDAIHQHRNLAELSRRDRLIDEVCSFYLANGINVGPLIAEKLQLMDFQHGYLLNRFKYSLLKLAIQTVLANERGLNKLRILLPIQLLKINLIWIYEDFKKEGEEWEEATVLRSKEDWKKVVRRENLSRNFLMIGFFYFQLIEHNNQVDRESNEDEADTATSEEKEKQKIVKKFFSSISEKQKNQQRLHALDREVFAQQMKLFYNKYYEAYDFFRKRSATIQANIYGTLVQLYFPIIPLCYKITDHMKERLVQQAQRISHEEKIKSLMAFEKETFDFLQGEEDYFIEIDKRSALAGRVAKLVKNQDTMYFFVWAMSVVIVLGYLIDDFQYPQSNFAKSFATYLIPTNLISLFILLCSLINLGCGCLLLINIIFRKVPFLMRLYEYKYQQELEQEGEMKESMAVYQAKHILSASFFDFYCLIFSILTILHPLFAGFLLVYIVKRIELGKTIVRAIQETWFSLFVAAALLIVFNYIFSILIYCASFTNDVGYGTTCKTLFTCLLMLVDQSLKAGSGFLATNTSDFTYMTLNFKVIAEIMYILFAQKVIFEIFSGTIIDKFGELREQGDSTEEDEKSNCYICGQERFEIDFELEGFEQHVEKTHNKLNYIYYLFYLRRKSKTEYGIEDSYIWQALEKANNDWIPDGTSIEKELKQHDNEEHQDEQHAIEEYEKFFQKKLQEFKKLHVKVENMSGLLKDDNLF